MADPTGFQFLASTESHPTPVRHPDPAGRRGSPARNSGSTHASPCHAAGIRLVRNGTQVGLGHGRSFSFRVHETGVYRLEGWLSLDGEERAWIYSNPIYVR